MYWIWPNQLTVYVTRAILVLLLQHFQITILSSHPNLLQMSLELTLLLMSSSRTTN